MPASLLNRSLQAPSLREGAALHEALQRAEAHFSRGDHGATWAALRPHVQRFVPAVLAGPLWEMCAACATAGLAPLDAHQALTRALHAYQQEHDVPGMARVHSALGSWLLAAGDLPQAAREFGYAQQLGQRSGQAAQRVGSLCRQAEVSILQGVKDPLQRQIEQAVSLCRSLNNGEFLEAQTRVLAAQAAWAAGRPQEVSRQLLWAERLLQRAQTPANAMQGGLSGAAGASAGPHVALALMRAEAMYRLHFPRRGIACLKQAGALLFDEADALRAPLEGRAHKWRLSGACLLSDEPAKGLHALELAENAFVRLRHVYYRAFCQIAAARALYRLGHTNEAQARLDVVAAGRLARWPMLQEHYKQAQQEVRVPAVRVRGAVSTPYASDWVAHTQRCPSTKAPAAQPAPRDETSEPTDAAAGLFGRLQHAWGRWRDAHAPH